MTSRNLLVELLVQELPPKALQKLGEAFAAVLGEQLLALGLASTASVVTPYASPRRLAAHVIAAAEPAPSPALLKKRQALGADICDPAAAVAALRRAQDGKGQALFYDRIVPGATLAAGVVALHGSTVVPVKALGLTAGNCTQGHRFEAVVSPVLLSDADGYAAT